MTGLAIILAIAAATNFILPPATVRPNHDANSQSAIIDGTRINGVIYHDAPTSSVPILRR